MSHSQLRARPKNYFDGKDILEWMFTDTFQLEPSSMDLIAAIKKGLPGNTIGNIAEVLKVSKSEIYFILKMKPKTAQRAATKPCLPVGTSDHIVQIMKIYKRCLAIFGNRDKATRWLNNSNYSLGNEIPLHLMDTIEGISLVNDTVTRIEYGVFA